MVNPVYLTDYQRNNYQLEELLTFGILVAGKNALTTAKNLAKFLPAKPLPFQYLNQFTVEELASGLKSYGFGCYNLKAQSLYQLVRAKLDLRKCSLGDLCDIKGIGLKTANLFLMHTRKEYRGACLDVHLLKYLRSKGIHAPKNTPSSIKKYMELQEQYLALADQEGRDPAEMDLAIWREYSGNHE